MTPRRTQFEIVQALESVIRGANQEKFFKSDFREMGINSATAADWFRMIEYIQIQFPKVRVVEHERTMIIEVIDK